MTAGELIRDIRRRQSLTQLGLARRLGITQPSVARLEAAGDAVTVATLTRVLNAMGHRVELLGERLPSSVDETLLVENLTLTPGERIERFERWAQDVRVIHGIARPEAPARRTTRPA